MRLACNDVAPDLSGLPETVAIRTDARMLKRRNPGALERFTEEFAKFANFAAEDLPLSNPSDFHPLQPPEFPDQLLGFAYARMCPRVLRQLLKTCKPGAALDFFPFDSDHEVQVVTADGRIATSKKLFSPACKGVAFRTVHLGIGPDDLIVANYAARTGCQEIVLHTGAQGASDHANELSKAFNNIRLEPHA